MTTITGTTVTTGITLGQGGYGSPLTIDSTGAVEPSSGTAIFASGSYGAATVVNGGSIVATGAQGVGIKLVGGGSVTNGGRINASQSGIELGTGTVTNSGVISGGTAGIDLLAGGTVIDSGTIAGGGGTAVMFGGAGANRLVLDPGYVLSGIVVGSISSGSTNTLELASAASAGTLSKPIHNEFLNFGTIEVDSGAQWVLPGYDRIGSGITLNNAGTLTLPKFLVFDSSTMINSGSVLGSIRLTGASYLDDSGTIRAIGSAVYGYGGANTVVNAGTISGSTGIGIFLHTGGTLVNSAATALVVGYDAGVKINGGAGTISNSGTIAANYPGPAPTGDGVDLLSGGSVSNSGVILGNHYGVLIAGAAGTLDNLGAIAGIGGFGIGAYLEGGGYVRNAATGIITGSTDGVSIRTVLVDGTVVNQGTIRAAGRLGVDLEGGGYVNNAATGLIASSYTGVGMVGSAGRVANSGTIQSTGTFGDGVDLLDGGGVGNAATGLIVGTRYGVLMIRGAGTITNGGTVAVTGSLGVDGIYLSAGGFIGNASTGLITGPKTGVLVAGSAATVVNLGVISATDVSGIGIDLAGGGTVVDAGTIAGGGTAIAFGGTSANLLVLEAGYRLSGAVSGSTSGGATNMLELTSTISNPLTATYNSLGLVNFQDITFGGGYATLDITNTAGMPGVVFSGFTLTSETIDLAAIGTNGTISSTDMINHRVTISGSLGAVTLQFDATDSFNLATSPDGTAGTNVSPVCFCRGTLILTANGEVPVEALKVGDRVRTLSGSLKPIVWIGFGRDLVTRANRLARPIMVRRGALADDVPRRDLYLTHGHALYVDGVLIPVEHLVNHRSIAWDAAARVVEYYHVELADHDVLFAEGAPAESYYDASNRVRFQNTRGGSAAGAAKATFAPVLSRGDVVENVWARLFARAGGSIDADTIDDPDLHLVIDGGARVDPTTIEEEIFTFALDRPPASTLRLRSRSGVPSLLGQGRADHRPLGVAIREIILENAGIATQFEHDAPQLREGGCHLPEDGFCWTDGEFELPARFFNHLNGALVVTVRTKRHGLRYPISTGSIAA